jgi:hypothetical protein
MKARAHFLTGIAALFLPTGTAHAGRYNNWKCSDGITLQTAIEKINPPNSLPVTYGFNVEGLRVPRVRVTIGRDGEIRVNGKRCTHEDESK